MRFFILSESFIYLNMEFHVEGNIRLLQPVLFILNFV